MIHQAVMQEWNNQSPHLYDALHLALHAVTGLQSNHGAQEALQPAPQCWRGPVSSKGPQ